MGSNHQHLSWRVSERDDEGSLSREGSFPVSDSSLRWICSQQERLVVGIENKKGRIIKYSNVTADRLAAARCHGLP